jgi:hypothetical protein
MKLNQLHENTRNERADTQSRVSENERADTQSRVPEDERTQSNSEEVVIVWPDEQEGAQAVDRDHDDHAGTVFYMSPERLLSKGKFGAPAQPSQSLPIFPFDTNKEKRVILDPQEQIYQILKFYKSELTWKEIWSELKQYRHELYQRRYEVKNLDQYRVAMMQLDKRGVIQQTEEGKYHLTWDFI